VRAFVAGVVVSSALLFLGHVLFGSVISGPNGISLNYSGLQKTKIVERSTTSVDKQKSGQTADRNPPPTLSAAQISKQRVAKAFQQTHRIRVELDYHRFLQGLKLTESEREKFVTLITQRRMLAQDTVDLYREGAIETPEELQITYAELLKQSDKEITGLLNGDGQRYTDYTRQLFVDYFVAEIWTSTASAESNPVDRTKLAQALNDRYRDQPAEKLLDPYLLPSRPKDVGKEYINQAEIYQKTMGDLVKAGLDPRRLLVVQTAMFEAQHARLFMINAKVSQSGSKIPVN
jgi:hypothetical protein